jgi:spore germination protein KB
MKLTLDKISHGQLGCLCFGYLSGFSTVFLLEAKLLKQDVWMSSLIGITLAAGVLWLWCYVQWQHPHLKTVEVFDRLLGHWLAKLVLCVYLVYFLEIQGEACRSLAAFYTTVVLPNTPPNQLILLIVLTSSYAVFQGLGAIARTIQVILPFFIAAILVISFFIFREVEMNPFFPQFQHRISEVVYGGMISFYFPFGKIITLGFLLSQVKNTKKIFVSSVTGIACSGLYLLVATYLTFGSLGMYLTQSTTFPYFSAIQMVKFGEYLERIEIIIIAIWSMFTFFEIIMLQYVFTIVFRHVFGLKNVNAFIVPIGLLFFAIAQKSFIRISDLTQYNLKVGPFSTLLPAVIIPVVLAILTLVRKKAIN